MEEGVRIMTATETLRVTRPSLGEIIRQFRPEFAGDLINVGPDILAWLPGVTSLFSGTLNTNPVSETANAVFTNEVFRRIFRGLSDSERQLAQVEFEFDILNTIDSPDLVRPDGTYVHESGNVPSILRFDHRVLGERGIAIFMVSDTKPNLQQFFMAAACRIEKINEVVSEIEKYGYRFEEPKEETEEEAVLIAA